MDSGVAQEVKIKQLIDSHNFNLVIQSLRDSLHWSNEEITAALKQYKNFLFLKWKYGDSHTLPPSVDIDEVWHAHILHTKDYQQFCNDVYGKFLHHHPSEERNKKTQYKMQLLFEQETQSLYQKEFGDFIYSVRQPFWRKWFKRVFRL